MATESRAVAHDLRCGSPVRNVMAVPLAPVAGVTSHPSTSCILEEISTREIRMVCWLALAEKFLMPAG